MIESKLKANNCNRGQLFRPYWVSSARHSKLYEVISWLTDIHILTIRWWWPQMQTKMLPVHHYATLSSIFWGRRSFQIRYAAHFLTWFGHDFLAGQFVPFRSFLIATTTWYSGFFLLSLVTRFACDIGQLARIWIGVPSELITIL